MAVFEGTFVGTDRLRFAIVIARFNDLITGKLLNGCKDALKRHGVNVAETGGQVDYAWVPGCFEIPIAARQLVATQRYDAVICLGAVVRGQTPHFDYVAAEVSKGIAAISLQTGVPVIYGILTTDTMQQAIERAGVKANLGWNYGMHAIEMATLLPQIRQPLANSPTETAVLAADASSAQFASSHQSATLPADNAN